MAGTQHERVLAAEMLVVMGVETMDALSGADTGSFKLPDPSRYFATVIVFMMLAGMAMFGEKAGKLASTFGGVASLTILIAPTKKTGKPLVMSAMNYFNQLITGGTQGTPITTSTSTSTSTSSGFKSVVGGGSVSAAGAAVVNSANQLNQGR